MSLNPFKSDPLGIFKEGVPDPVELVKDPIGVAKGGFEGGLELLKDPLSGLQGLPGIDGTESAADTGRLETARVDQTSGLIAQQEAKKKKILAATRANQDIGRRETISTGPRGLADEDTAGIATRTLLG